MKKVTCTILLIQMVFTFTSCVRIWGHQSILFVNQSDTRLRMLYSTKSELFHREELDNGLYPCDNACYAVGAHSQFQMTSSIHASGWEAMLENDSLLVFCCDGVLYDKYIHEPCDTIHKYLPLLHCYRLSRADLDAMDWTVVYPPQEE